MDLKIVYMQDSLDITEATSLNTMPPTVEVRGEDFRSASSVLINNMLSPSFSIRSKTTIIAELPEDTTNIQDIAVVSNRFTAQNNSLLRFEIGTSPQITGGLQRLLQRFTMLLLRSPGSDILEPEVGGGLGGLIHRFSRSAYAITTSDIVLAVNRTKRQMYRRQATDPYLKPSERLADAELLGVEHSPEVGFLSPQIRLTSQAGDSAMATLGDLT